MGAQNNSLLKCCYYRISCNQVREAFTTHHRILIPGIRVGTSFTKQEGQVAVRSRVSSVSHFYFPFQPSCYIWEWLDLCTVINSVVISFIRQQSKGGRVPSEPSARPPDFCLSQCLGMTQNSTPCKWPYERMTLLIPNQTLKSWPQLSKGTGRGVLHHQMLDLSGNAGVVEPGASCMRRPTSKNGTKFHTISVILRTHEPTFYWMGHLVHHSQYILAQTRSSLPGSQTEAF